MNFESTHRDSSAARVEVPSFSKNIDSAGTIQLPNGESIALQNIIFKGPLENATYEGNTEDGNSVRIATETKEGVTTVVGVWIDDESIYTQPTDSQDPHLRGFCVSCADVVPLLQLQKEYTMICERCEGSGSLFRPNEDVQLKDSFKKCTDCGGRGTTHHSFGPRFIGPKALEAERMSRKGNPA
jgi:hypothetical protein